MGDSGVLRAVRPARRRMRPRAVVAVAVLGVAWTAAYCVMYLLVASHQQQPAVAWWYVAVLGCAGVLLLIVPFTGSRAARAAVATITAVLLAGCVLVGLLSVGLLLVPGVVFALLAAVLPGRRPEPAEQHLS